MRVLTLSEFKIIYYTLFFRLFWLLRFIIMFFLDYIVLINFLRINRWHQAFKPLDEDLLDKLQRPDMLHWVSYNAFPLALGFYFSQNSLINAELNRNKSHICAPINRHRWVKSLHSLERLLYLSYQWYFAIFLRFNLTWQRFLICFHKCVKQVVVHIFDFSCLHSGFH